LGWCQISIRKNCCLGCRRMVCHVGGHGSCLSAVVIDCLSEAPPKMKAVTGLGMLLGQ
jgi:hypothetical protein